jgi:hypothetical protein
MSATPILAAAVSEGVHLLPWVITLMIGVALSILAQLGGAIWFASRVNSELKEAKQDISALSKKLGEFELRIETKIEDFRREVSGAFGGISERVAHIEGKLNGRRER